MEKLVTPKKSEFDGNHLRPIYGGKKEEKKDEKKGEKSTQYSNLNMPKPEGRYIKGPLYEFF